MAEPKELKLLNCHQVIPNMDIAASTAPDLHDFHELVFVAEGRYAVQLGTQSHELGAGQGAVYPAGVKHLPKVSRDGATKLMLLQWQGPLVSADDAAVFFEDISGHIRSSIFWLHGLPMHDHQRDDQRHAILRAVLEQIRWQLATGVDFDDPIAEMHRFMQSTCSHAITMELLSKRSGLAISTIGQKFRQRYGLAPMQFLQRVRAQTAANLLRGSSADLTDIAKQVGLTSPSHLSRLVKKHLGVSVRSLRS